jgi:hypothetical protein
MYSIKEATVADTDAIISIATETYWSVYGPILTEEQIIYMLGTIYSVETISGQIKNNAQSFLLLLEDEEPVAFAAYAPRAEDPEVYKLHKLYCLPKTQGKGYGKDCFVPTHDIFNYAVTNCMFSSRASLCNCLFF